MSFHDLRVQSAQAQSGQTHSSQFQNDGLFRPRVSIFEESRRFALKTVTTRREFLAALKLRYEIFHGEFRGEFRDDAQSGGQSLIGFDVDQYDDHSDSLIIIDKLTSEIVGTYRILNSDFTDRFYSSEEFQVASLLAQSGVKIELSRACVKQGFRNGAVIHLLWRGIYRYIRETNARFLFGCSSLAQAHPAQVKPVQRRFIESDRNLTKFEIYPHAHCYFDSEFIDVPETDHPSSPADISELGLDKLIPPLLQLYLKAGARVALIPAWDEFFRCFDFFTLLEVQDLNPAFAKTFGD